MVNKLAFVATLFLLLSGCDNNGTDPQHSMVGGGGMMGKIEIPGEPPPRETDTRYVQGYRQA